MLATLAGGTGDEPQGDWLRGEGEGAQVSYVANQMLVWFNSSVTPQQRNQLAASQGASVVRAWNHNIALVEFSGGNVNIASEVAEWNGLSQVRVAEPNYIYQIEQLIPNDPLFGQMWHLHNIGQNPPLGTFDADIDAPEGWEISTGSPNTVVAVIDTGIDFTHPDFNGRLWRNEGEIPGDGVDNDGNGYIDDIVGIDPANGDSDPFDTDGHGTHVAGTIGAGADNAIGTVGVDWNTKIMSLQAFTSFGGSGAAIVEALNYMVMMKTQYGVNIVASNNSWGGGAYSAIQEFVIGTSIDAGIIFIASAGNGGADGIGDDNDLQAHFPSGYNLDGIISVAASDLNDNLGFFSNYGQFSVDLAAPGVDVLSTFPLAQGGIGFNSGTSMAAPHVTGVASILAGLDPTLSVTELKDVILRGVDPIDGYQDFIGTGGRLNLANSIRLLPSGEISGMVYQDQNGNGVRDAGELGLPNATVFMDVNQNGTLDPTEPFATSGFDGRYTINNFRGPGTFEIIQLPLPGFQPTNPSDGSRTVIVVVRDQDVPNVDFGNRIGAGDLSGVVWNDLDGNGRFDAETEVGLPGVYVYLDLDDNGRMSLSEPKFKTGPDGTYNIDLQQPGEYIVRVNFGSDPGWRRTFPENDDFQTIDIPPDGGAEAVDFGFQSNLDYGDTPSTIAADLTNPPVHGIVPNFHLGATVAGEGPNGMGATAAAADNDGIVFLSSVLAGRTTTLLVEVSTGNNPRGYLQGWADFNHDGDMTDPGEQIIRNVRLGEGIHEVTFATPASIIPGDTRFRFRYGYERDLGPQGRYQAGEVEEYIMPVRGFNPLANPDSYVLQQGVIGEVLDVLDNDFESANGGLRIVSVTQPGNGASVAIRQPAQDALIFSSPTNFSSPPVLTFQYTIADAANNQSTTTVAVNITPTFVNPVAVDDSYTVQEGSRNNPLPVLDNDIVGTSPPIRLLTVSNPPNGTATIDTRGTGDPSDDRILYTPDAGFGGTDQFTYTIVNGLGGTDTAQVTMQVQPGASLDDRVDIRLMVTDLAGNDLTSLGVGQEFLLNVIVEDVRPNPPISQEGVFAAYLDILYDSGLVSVVPSGTNPLGFAVTFGADFGNGASGNPAIPGLIDEFGSFARSQNPLGTGAFLMASIRLRTEAAGVATFVGDPADILPEHDTLLFQPTTPLTIPQIGYGFDDLVIGGGGGGGEGEYDTDRNGVISPADVLNVVNFLNSNGPMALPTFANGGGEGEQTLDALRSLDTNRDNFISAVDALGVINYLNGSSGGNGEGEYGAWYVGSEPDAPVAAPGLVVPAVDESSVPSGPPSLAAPAVRPELLFSPAGESEWQLPRRRTLTNTAADNATLPGAHREARTSAVAAPPLGADVRLGGKPAARDALDEVLDQLAADVAGAWLG